jgi:predicted nucleotidyltransferase
VPSQPSGLTTLLTALAASGVEFVLVGGLAAVAQGAPITTFDVDIVHERTPNNIDRLLAFLARFNARYRGRPGSDPLPPSRTALEGPGHSLFMTDLGPLDVLGAIEDGLSFEDLIRDSVSIDLDGHAVRVLSLPAIVRIKRRSNHPKDQQALPVLEEALRQLTERE